MPRPDPADPADPEQEQGRRDARSEHASRDEIGPGDGVGKRADDRAASVRQQGDGQEPEGAAGEHDEGRLIDRHRGEAVAADQDVDRLGDRGHEGQDQAEQVEREAGGRVDSSEDDDGHAGRGHRQRGELNTVGTTPLDRHDSQRDQRRVGVETQQGQGDGDPPERHEDRQVEDDPAGRRGQERDAGANRHRPESDERPAAQASYHQQTTHHDGAEQRPPGDEADRLDARSLAGQARQGTEHPEHRRRDHDGQRPERGPAPVELHRGSVRCDSGPTWQLRAGEAR